MMLGLKYKCLFPPKVPPFQFIFLERRESVGGVLNSFLEKRVIDSDFFTMQKRSRNQGVIGGGKIYSDHTVMNLSIACSVNYRADLIR
jgi:hypothetical protein